MKFIYIYGAPVTGKLTVSNELSELTDFKVFHNHLTVDLIKPFLEFGTEPFYQLSNKLKWIIFESLAKENISGIIFTSCYSHPEDNEVVKKINIIEKKGGEMYFIHLYAQI